MGRAVGKLCFWCLCFLLFFTVSQTVSSSQNVTGVEKDFQDFIRRFGKKYTFGTDEYKKRLQIFKSNLATQAELNAELDANATTKYGVNKFSDLSAEEFREHYLKYVPPATPALPGSDGPLKFTPGGKTENDLPLKFDWREKNVVTSVKNQKSCGGCWAFSTVETIESQYAIDVTNLKSLSPQEVVDCSYGFNGVLFGCKGGDTWNALEWMQKTQLPLVTLHEYKLTDTQQSCKVLLNQTKGVRLKSYTRQDFRQKSEDPMLHLLSQHGPLSVAVDATTWHNYQGGIIQYHCGLVANNHAAVIVGYDVSGPIPYYIVKNSWGTDFGDKGYIYIRKDGNVCGIAQEVAAVEVYH